MEPKTEGSDIECEENEDNIIEDEEKYEEAKKKCKEV